MSNLTISLNASISITDNTQSVPPQVALLSFYNPTLLATYCFYDPFFQAAPGGTIVTLPAATIYAAIVINRDPANQLTVSYTPAGGTSQSSGLIGPNNGAWLYFRNDETTGGITSMTITGQAATVPCTVLVAA